MIKRWLEKLTKLNQSLVFRINILKIVCLLIFLIIAIQLYHVHVTFADQYTSFLQNNISANSQRNVPRGIITDRHGTVLVDNEAVNIITFQPSPTMSVDEMREIATELAKLIEVDSSNLTSRDLSDLFIIEFPDEAEELMTAEELRELDDEEYYLLKLRRIEDEHREMLSEEQKAIHTIYIQMSQGSNLLANTVKYDASHEEIAIVSENLPRLPGVGVDVDWERIYPSELESNSLFGQVTSYDQGVPATQLEHYLAYGYARNARVGRSNLELTYQSLLGGFPSQYLVENGNATRITEGQSGFELALTLDAELQEAVSEIVERELLNARGSTTTRYLQEAYVVITNPNTGEILALVGKRIEDDSNSVIDDPAGTFHRAFTVGSTVKAATLLAGYEHGVTNIGTSRLDRPLVFADGTQKASHVRSGLGNVNDILALSWSSNIYFMRQTLELAGIPNFTDRSSLAGFDLGVFDTYRRFFADFGLGVSTGINLPSESIGQRDSERTAPKALDFSIGQADTYTTLQLAQFASTLATNGERYAMQLVRDVYLPSNNPEDQQLLYGFTPNLLNTVDLDDLYWERVHLGHRQALTGPNGTGASAFGPNVPFNPAGKTGTAQDFARDSDGWTIRDSANQPINVHNRSFIGYAPYDNPEMAIAVIVPQNQLPDNPTNEMSLIVARQAMEAYFDLQKERAQ